jgi:hypothetical protein
VPAPPFAKIDAARVTPMSFADDLAQGVFRGRHGNQMNVVGHEAIASNLNPPLTAPSRHQLQLRLIIVVPEKGLLATIATLRGVVGHSGNNDSRYSAIAAA